MVISWLHNAGIMAVSVQSVWPCVRSLRSQAAVQGEIGPDLAATAQGRRAELWPDTGDMSALVTVTTATLWFNASVCACVYLHLCVCVCVFVSV